MTSTTGTPHHLPNLQPTQLLAAVPRENLHPSVRAEAERRAASVQLRVADAITAFAGSMNFVYVHVVLFAVWCGTGLFGLDKFPFEFLTMAVSLEAIFLSTFVMIGQNRSAAFQQSKADRDYNSQEKLLEENTDLTRVIHELSQQIHEMVKAEIAAQGLKPSTPAE